MNGQLTIRLWASYPNDSGRYAFQDLSEQDLVEAMENNRKVHQQLDDYSSFTLPFPLPSQQSTVELAVAS